LEGLAVIEMRLEWRGGNDRTILSMAPLVYVFSPIGCEPIQDAAVQEGQPQVRSTKKRASKGANMIRSLKTLVLGSLVAAGALAAGAAHAGRDVYWSVDVQAPGYPVGVGASFSNAPRVVAYPQPVYVAPPPVVYAPPPVVYVPRPVYVQPRPVYHYGPPAYYYDHPRHRRHWRHDHWHKHDKRHHRGRDWDD
jgi:hypothetical protein